MATILLLIIYIAFIGLGIPDSLFGTAWPAIYREFSLPVASANFVTLLISGGTVISSFLSARLIHRFGTGMITAASTALTAAALFGFSLSNNLYWLCLFAIPLGIGAGAIDSALNNYVALHYKASHMNFLHCFYGVGVSLSPYLMSLALADQANWRGGYRIVFYLQAVIAALTICALPLWSRVHKNSAVKQTNPPRTLTIAQMVKMPCVRLVCLAFLGSCALEYTCGVWGSTFLVDAKGMIADHAAQAITFYYAGMALGRFLAGVLAGKLSSWRLIQTGQAITLAAIVLLLLPLPSAAACTGLFLVGLGNGPLFPNLIHLTPSNFSRESSQSVMGVQMAASYMGIMLLPPLFGLLAQGAGVKWFPFFLLAMYVIMLLATLLLIQKLKKQNRYSF